MYSRILIYGLVAGAIVGTELFVLVLTMHGHSERYGELIGYLTMLVALSAIFVAVKRHRDLDLGGVIGFWRGLAMGLGISTIAGILYVLSWEAALAVTHLDFAAAYSKALIAQQKAKGVHGAELARFEAQMAAFRAQYANPVYRFAEGFTEIFPVGVLVSLVSAGLLCNRRFLPLRRN